MAFLVMFLSETGSLRSISVTMPPAGGLRHQLGDQGLFAADQDVAADEVLKLADVSGPVVVLHQTDGASGEQFRGVVEDFCIMVDEVVDQDGQIGDSLAQGWQIDGHCVDAEEEIQAEGAVFDLVAEIAVGGRDEAGGDGAGLVAADPDEGAILQDLEELGLNCKIEAADLIEEERAVVGLLDAAELGGHGPGKCALFVAEELGFKQGVRDGRTAHLDK